MVDLLLKSRPFNPKVAEVAMILRYDQKPTPTKMKIFKTIFQTVNLLVKRKVGIFK
jgi:dolichol-phosphate mannosyltransferase